MGALDGKTKTSTNGKTATANGSANGTIYQERTDLGIDLGAALQIPRFMPQNLIDMGLCNSEEQLNQVRANLAQFRKVAQWTKAKFKAQEAAADIALDLAKSQNALVAYFAKTMLKQAKSDAELAALLQALPEMVAALGGQVAAKKEKKVKDFTERLNAAGKGKTVATTTKTK